MTHPTRSPHLWPLVEEWLLTAPLDTPFTPEGVAASLGVDDPADRSVLPTILASPFHSLSNRLAGSRKTTSSAGSDLLDILLRKRPAVYYRISRGVFVLDSTAKLRYRNGVPVIVNHQWPIYFGNRRPSAYRGARPLPTVVPPRLVQEPPAVPLPATYPEEEVAQVLEAQWAQKQLAENLRQQINILEERLAQQEAVVTSPSQQVTITDLVVVISTDTETIVADITARVPR